MLSDLVRDCEPEELKQVIAALQAQLQQASPSSSSSSNLAPPYTSTSTSRHILADIGGSRQVPSNTNPSWIQTVVSGDGAINTSPPQRQDVLLHMLSSAAANEAALPVMNESQTAATGGYSSSMLFTQSSLHARVEDCMEDGPLLGQRFVQIEQVEDDVDVVKQVIDNGSVSESSYLQDIFFPGWPKELPGPVLMDQIIEIFFAVVPIMPHILHRQRFLLRMTLPPTHKDFPYVGLLHAICAATSRYFGGVYTEPSTENIWRSRERPDDPNMIPCFGRRHEAFARRAVETSISNGEDLFPCTQALAILLHHYYCEARWMDGWITEGILCRLLAPLGVTNQPQLLPSGKMNILPPPKDAIERQERVNLVWVAVICDLIMESSSGWPGALNFNELVLPLPCDTTSLNDSDGPNIPINDQDPKSPDLWTRHPVEDSFCMLVKACLLLRKVNQFVRELLWNDGFATARNSTPFRDLDAQIGTFILTFPPCLRDPLTPPKSKFRKTMNHDLMVAQMMLHIMALKLHEPFVQFEDLQDPSTRRVLAAARGILKLVYLLSGTNYDSRMFAYGEYPVMSAARALIGFLEVEMALGPRVTENRTTLEAEIEVLRMLFVMRGQKFPVGLRISQMIDFLIEQAKQVKGEASEASVPYRNPAPCAPTAYMLGVPRAPKVATEKPVLQ